MERTERDERRCCNDRPSSPWERSMNDHPSVSEARPCVGSLFVPIVAIARPESIHSWLRLRTAEAVYSLRKYRPIKAVAAAASSSGRSRRLGIVAFWGDGNRRRRCRPGCSDPIAPFQSRTCERRQTTPGRGKTDGRSIGSGGRRYCTVARPWQERLRRRGGRQTTNDNNKRCRSTEVVMEPSFVETWRGSRYI